MEIIRMSDENHGQAIAKAVEVLKKGGIVVYPTDTVYGLAVDALNRPALERLRQLKGREAKKPISIIVPTVGDIDTYADLHPAAWPIAERHLPGALTLVLQGRNNLPEELMLNKRIGIRVPGHTLGRTIADMLGRPITATSANRAGLQTPKRGDQMIQHFGPLSEHIDLIIDAGEMGGGTPSTVLTFMDGVPYVLREGAIPKTELGI